MANSESRSGVDAHSHLREALLLQSHPDDGGAASYCRHHLAPPPASDPAPVVVVADAETAGASRTARYVDRPGIVVAVGATARSTATVADSDSLDGPVSPPRTIVETGDLGSAGRTVDECLTNWAASGHRPIVCVDSLSGFLRRDSIPGVYRFLYVLLHRVEDVGGAAHAHVDPREHEEEILRTFHSLFDRVISFRDLGTLR